MPFGFPVPHLLLTAPYLQAMHSAPPAPVYHWLEKDKIFWRIELVVFRHFRYLNIRFFISSVSWTFNNLVSFPRKRTEVCWKQLEHSSRMRTDPLSPSLTSGGKHQIWTSPPGVLSWEKGMTKLGLIPGQMQAVVEWERKCSFLPCEFQLYRGLILSSFYPALWKDDYGKESLEPMYLTWLIVR